MSLPFVVQSPCLVTDAEQNTIAATPKAEQEFVAKLLGDDAKAWREFGHRYSRLVHACIARVVARFPGLATHDDITEIYASYCLSLLANDKRKLRSFDPNKGARLGSWLSMLAMHAAYDHLRSLRRQPTGPSADELFDLHDEQPDPLEACSRREQAALLTALMSELTEKDRQFMMLHYGQGFEPEQVAEMMGISIKTVYTKKHKLRAKLEIMLSAFRCAA